LIGFFNRVAELDDDFDWIAALNFFNRVAEIVYCFFSGDLSCLVSSHSIG